MRPPHLIDGLVEDLDLPPTRVAEGAWDAAARRVRRRRTAVVGAVTLATAGVVLTVSVLPHDGRDAAPTPEPAAPSATHVQGAGVVTRGMTTVLDEASLENLVDASPLVGADSAVPGAPLSEDPVPYAVYAVGRGDDLVQVLGPDARYHAVDVPELQPIREAPYRINPLRPTSLDPSATRLALPQPDGLIVVDLTTGEHRAYEVPGPANVAVSWVDDRHVQVTEEGVETGHVVDLETGEVERSRFGAVTRFAGDQTVTWGVEAGESATSTATWADGSTVTTTVDNSAGAFPAPPLVDDSVLIGLTYEDGGALRDQTTGVVAVDRATGDPAAYLTTGNVGTDMTTQLLGWAGDQVLVALSTRWGLQVASWDWTRSAVAPVTFIGTEEPATIPISWGRGWERVVADN